MKTRPMFIFLSLMVGLISATQPVLSHAKLTHKYHAQQTNKQKTQFYNLTIDYQTVNFTGHDTKAMLINNTLPAPTLYFKEGQKVVVQATNKMNVETSIHWHGILLPNFQDGVPYLTTPPILPGKTHRFEFTLKQAGTYWYHSHTGLQEQRGVYGAIVIEPRKNIHHYDHNLVLVLSDWTDESPYQVLRTLKRGSEWYAIKKQTALSLVEVIANQGLTAQLAMWRQRMPGMDISDVYYDTFLVNGQNEQHYPQFKAGEKIRLRVVNASASTYFWLSLGAGGGKNGRHQPLLISADGMDIKPITTNKILSAIAETYDFLITVPKSKSIEFLATAQDGSGTATALIGKGPVIKAPVIEKPNLIQQMKDMAKHHHGGADSHHMQHNKHSQNNTNNKLHNNKPHKKQRFPVIQSSVIPQNLFNNLFFKNNRKPAQHNTHQHNSHPSHTQHKTHLSHKAHSPHKITSQHQAYISKNTRKQHTSHSTSKKFNYDHLKSLKSTAFPAQKKVRKIHFNLTGNMRQYVWSINGKTLSESDKIKINKGEIVQIHLHNTTMMHHPMHLHGHFFRVLNKHGKYSPLKHTVDVPPMQIVILEFEPNTEGDWFFHCHVLYHMKSGMSRVFTQGDKRDSRLKESPLSKIWDSDTQWYPWAELQLMTNQFNWELVTSNTNHSVAFDGIFSWVDHAHNFHQTLRAELLYTYFMTNSFHVHLGGEAENMTEGIVTGVEDMAIVGLVGFEYTLPYLVELDLSINDLAEWKAILSYEILLLPRTDLSLKWGAVANFGWFHPLPEDQLVEYKQFWAIGLNYIMSKNFSIVASYSNLFNWGAGINWSL